MKMICSVFIVSFFTTLYSNCFAQSDSISYTVSEKVTQLVEAFVEKSGKQETDFFIIGSGDADTTTLLLSTSKYADLLSLIKGSNRFFPLNRRKSIPVIFDHDLRFSNYLNRIENKGASNEAIRSTYILLQASGFYLRGSIRIVE